MGENEDKSKEIQTINNTFNGDFSSLYIPTAVFEKDSIVDETEEKAIMLSKAFQNVDNEWSFRSKCIIMGLLYIIIGIILGAYLILESSSHAGLIALLGLIILGLAVLIYGVYLITPCYIKSLSKIFHISYILPYQSALLFDGSGVLTEKKIKYTDFKSEDIEKLYLKNDSIESYENEKEMFEGIKRIKKEISKEEKKEFSTPVISTSGGFSTCLKEVIQKCENGFPSTNLLENGSSMNEALTGLEIIQDIKKDEKIFESIKNLKNFIEKSSEPFLTNINSDIDRIKDYFNKINSKLNTRFSSQRIDQKNNFNNIPYLSIHQKVIKSFEGHKEETLKTIANEGSDSISTIKTEGKNRKDEIRKGVEGDIEKIDEKIQELEDEVQIAYEKMIEENRMDSVDEKDPDKNDKVKNEHSKIVSELQSLKQKKEKFRNEMANQFIEIDKENDVEIEKIQKETKEKLIQARGEPLNTLIKNRDLQLERVERFLKMLDKERKKHLSPFLQRKEIIETHKNELLMKLDEIITERNALLTKIKEYKVDLEIEKPVRIAIPFWILELEHAKDNIVVFSPFKLDGKITSKIQPMFNLSEMRDYFINEKILENARKFSIVGYITPSLEKALNSMVIDRIIPRRYYNGIKRMGGEI